MLTAARALTLNSRAGPPLPQVRDLQALYEYGCTPRQNELIMIAGRPGHQKSGFALWWMAQMNLPTLYLSADMSGWQASIRMACMVTGRNVEQMELGLKLGSVNINEVLGDSRILFDFGKPLNWYQIDDALDGYVELFNAYPGAIVIDNLMDFEGGEAEYGLQMQNLQIIDAMKADTGATVVVLHHATDKGDLAKKSPELPPPRWEIKGGLAEKPELVLGVALDPLNLNFNIAVLKQRMGPSDSSGQHYVTLRAEPERTRFRAL